MAPIPKLMARLQFNTVPRRPRADRSGTLVQPDRSGQRRPGLL